MLMTNFDKAYPLLVLCFQYLPNHQINCKNLRAFHSDSASITLFQSFSIIWHLLRAGTVLCEYYTEPALERFTV